MYFRSDFWSLTVLLESHKIIVVTRVMLWHQKSWFVYVMGPSWLSADQLGAPVWGGCHNHFRFQGHTCSNNSGSLVQFGKEYTNSFTLFSCQNSLTHGSSHNSPAVITSCPLIGQNSFPPGADHLPSYVTPFNINILKFGQAVSQWLSHRWIPITKASDAEVWNCLWSAPEQTVEQTIKTPVIWYAIVLIVTSL